MNIAQQYVIDGILANIDNEFDVIDYMPYTEAHEILVKVKAHIQKRIEALEQDYSTAKIKHAANTDAKHDSGKPIAGQMVNDFAHALQQVADVTTFGATKYSAGSWRTIPNAEIRYSNALYRHLLADAAGQQNDTESGLPHLAHAAWNVLALLELRRKGGV